MTDPSEAAFHAQLEAACADGSVSLEDADTLRDFAAFLTDPASRCLICLTDDQAGATWREHRRLGRVFLCAACNPNEGEQP